MTVFQIGQQAIKPTIAGEVSRGLQGYQAGQQKIQDRKLQQKLQEMLPELQRLEKEYKIAQIALAKERTVQAGTPKSPTPLSPSAKQTQDFNKLIDEQFRSGQMSLEKYMAYKGNTALPKSETEKKQAEENLKKTAAELKKLLKELLPKEAGEVPEGLEPVSATEDPDKQVTTRYEKPKEPTKLTKDDAKFYTDKGYTAEEAKVILDSKFGLKKPETMSPKDLAMELSRWQTIYNKTREVGVLGQFGEVHDPETAKLAEQKIDELRVLLIKSLKDEIEMTDPDGNTFKVPKSEVEDAKAHGWKVSK